MKSINIENMTIEQFKEYVTKADESLTKVKLIINGTKITVLNLSSQHQQHISDICSFMPKGAEYSTKYKNGEWDGYIRLYRNGKVAIGMLDTIIDYLNDRLISYEVQDNRTVPKLVNYNWQGVKLRDYQIKAVNQAIKVERAFISLPTGSGKTEIAMYITYQLKLPALIVVHRSELLYQWQKRLEDSFGIKVGLIGDGNFSESTITVAMIQTATKRLPKLNYGILITDEGHHNPAETYVKLAEKINAKIRLALSATPYREDNKQLLLVSQSGSIIQPIEVSDLIENGYLAKPEFIWLPGGTASGYTWQECLESIYSDLGRNVTMIHMVKKLFDKGHKIYVDVRFIEHGFAIEKDLNDNGIPTKFLYGKDKTDRRQDVLSNFKDGEYVLISTLIKEGVDLPEMTAVVLAGSGKSSIQVIQTIGRALRPKQPENKAIVVDFLDRGKYVGKWTSERQKIIKKYYKV